MEPYSHTKKTLVKNVVTKGGASKNTTVTLASASEGEQAAKAPIAGPTNKNFIKNPLFDQDNHYPGSGGRVEDWAGFAASTKLPSGDPSATYPIRYSSSPSALQEITLRAWNVNEKNCILRMRLQNAAHPGTSFELTKDFLFTQNDDSSLRRTISAVISGSEIAALVGSGNIADFQSCVFTLLDATPGPNYGSTKPGSDVKIRINSVTFKNMYQRSDQVIENYLVYGGAKIEPGPDYGTSGTLFVSVPDDSEYGHPYTKASVNGIGSTWNGNRMPAEWRHYCGLYSHALAGNNYDTFFGKRFRRIRKNKSDYEDIASMHPPKTADADGGYSLGPIQPRFIEIFPSGGLITERDDANYPQTDAERTHPDIAGVGLHRNTSTSPYWGSRDKWIKHSVCQTVKIPDNAVYCEYGAYVQVPRHPSAGAAGPAGPGENPPPVPYAQLSGQNFVSIQCSQDYGPGVHMAPHATSNPRVVRGDAIRIHKSVTASILPSSPDTITLPTAQYNWNGLATVYNPNLTESTIDANLNSEGPNYSSGLRWPTTVAFSAGDFDVEDFEEFKFVGRSWSTYTSNTQNGWYKESDLVSSLGGETYWPIIQKQLKYLQLELIHYEYRTDEIEPISLNGGLARFFNPSIQFFDSNNNVISPS